MDEPPRPASAGSTGSGDATIMLRRLSSGDPGAARELLPLVYDNLRGLAEAHFRGRPHGQTLQPTALVHEAYIKLVQHAETGWESRAHFFAVAASAMRQLLHDRARRRLAQKRGGGAQAVDLELIQPSTDRPAIDLIALDEALARLDALDPRQARIVELRFFSGLTMEEIARVLGLSTRMIEKEWRRTRAWLAAALGDERDAADRPVP